MDYLSRNAGLRGAQPQIPTHPPESSTIVTKYSNTTPKGKPETMALKPYTTRLTQELMERACQQGKQQGKTNRDVVEEALKLWCLLADQAAEGESDLVELASRYTRPIGRDEEWWLQDLRDSGIEPGQEILRGAKPSGNEARGVLDIRERLNQLETVRTIEPKSLQADEIERIARIDPVAERLIEIGREAARAEKPQTMGEVLERLNEMLGEDEDLVKVIADWCQVWIEGRREVGLQEAVEAGGRGSGSGMGSGSREEAASATSGLFPRAAEIEASGASDYAAFAQLDLAPEVTDWAVDQAKRRNLATPLAFARWLTERAYASNVAPAVQAGHQCAHPSAVRKTGVCTDCGKRLGPVGHKVGCTCLRCKPPKS